MTLEQNYFDTFPSVDNWKAATCFFQVYNFVYKVGDFPEKWVTGCPWSFDYM